MPPRAKGARLWLRRRSGREPKWIILDRGRQIPTSLGEGDSEQAEKALADYITNKYQTPQGASNPASMTIARALEIYGNEHAPSVASPETIGFHIDALLPYWGGRVVSEIRGATCRAYVKSRKVKATTARRELETLGAAVNYCHKEGYLLYAPRVTLPPKPKGKERWLTRNEAARLLLEARRFPHLRTFILVALYTGTRSAAIFNLQWKPNLAGGWIDLDSGLLYRGAMQRVETNKRQTPAPLPAKLIAHLRRARRRTRLYVIEYRGEKIDKLRRSWRTACDEAGLGADVTPHTLRHTSVTWRLLAGVQIRDVAEYVGMSEKMVRDTYGHHCPEHLLKARDAI